MNTETTASCCCGDFEWDSSADVLMLRCSTSHAGDNRRRKRKQEVKLDAADQEAEDAERAAARQKKEEEHELRVAGEANTTHAL